MAKGRPLDQQAGAAATPFGQSEIDRLIQALGLADAPVATWAERHRCEFLSCLAAAYAEEPTMFASYADRVLRYANYWSPEIREPIKGMRVIDRRSSFVGGFPWTSKEHPWPFDALGKPLAPILQLNLATLDTGPLQARADVLFQVWVWGNDWQPFCRSIPIAELAGNPDWSLEPWTRSNMYYRFEGFDDEEGWPTPTDLSWYDGRVVGEYVRTAPEWSFSLGRDLDIDPDEIQLCEHVPPDVSARWEELQELSYEVPQLNRGSWAETDITSGFFGGQMFAQRGSYRDFPHHRVLYSPSEGGDLYGSDEFGLYMWANGGSDGTLSVLLNGKTGELSAVAD